MAKRTGIFLVTYQMPARTKASTTRLPQSLRDEINESAGNDHHRTRLHSRPKLSRKATRKEERLNRKRHKAEYFSSGSARNKRLAEEDHMDSPQRKKFKHDTVTPSAEAVNRPHSTIPTKSTTAPEPAKHAAPLMEKKKTQTPLERLVAKSAIPRSVDRKGDEEDAYIAYLEAQLGYGKGRKKKSEEDDGLDDLLDFTDSLMEPLRRQEEEPEMDEEEMDSEESDEEADEGDISDEDVDDEDLDKDENLQSEGSDLDEEDDGWEGIKEEAAMDHEDASPKIHTPPAQESAARYIPPHLRNKESADARHSESMIKLSRQLKGLLNRMSEQNLAGILDSIEGIYREHRRNDVTTSLTTLITDSITSHSSLLDSYVVLYAALVSSLHKIVGVEFAAYFVQNVVSLYEQHFATSQTTSGVAEKTSDSHEQRDLEAPGKECSNLLVLLSELYNFQVISSVLVFDIIRDLLDAGLSEFCVELLLKIARNSGQQLRQDDPSALKDIIQIVHSKVSDKNDALSSRTRFMIETLTNLKNNKLKRNIAQNQGAESVERMKKFLAGLAKKKHVLAHEPLRVSLEDLRCAGTKGKWWIVGAAWAGDPLVDRQAEVKAVKLAENADPAGDLGKLARKQGMNTDIRRSIFVVLMSSDDYVDACDRLSQLNLTEVQQREIIRVLVHCCGNEKSYNPYYTLVGQQLCRTSHSYKITLQYCLWDFLRDLGETGVGGAELIKNIKDDDYGFDVKNVSTTRLRNVAKAYGWWIAKDCVTLAILKPVDFTSLKAQTKEFLREMLVQSFICSQRATPMIASDPRAVPTTRNRGTIEEIFIKATRIDTLAMGLVYFMSEAFRDVPREEDEMAKLIKWANELAKDTLRTGVDIVPTL
ncbi:putative protein with domain in DAP-5, eIF4G, MA-3 and other proteins [Lyophyllum shimeji]|uniref:MI domain-containing protein n=1 Tax=Lyophyllum shimeji TaxID=47721 RepID=A0A9P3PRB9_LYOSH|nr:putative protein with domain in DAP-5, eIF4G, MA-3 and other proteins [Lyophyllum shimeji]